MSVVNIVLDEEQREGTTATVAQWLINEGDFIEANEPLVELETDKVMMEIVAPVSGVLTKINLTTGDEIQGELILGVIDSSIQDKVSKTKKIPVNHIPKIANCNDQKKTNINNNATSPAVRRLLSQHNIDIKNILGTGKDHRVTSRDIHTFLKQQSASPHVNSKRSRLIPLSNMRKNIAKHMVQSLLHTAPHVTSVFNLDLSNIIAHRKANKQHFLEQKANLTFTAYFIAASKVAIQAVPMINSQLHDDNIEIFNDINIGIGTSLADEGLIVPVLKNCEERDLLNIAQELTRLTNKARTKTLQPIDIKNGTFTISNHGVSGSLIATPIIINQPQSAILGVGKMEKRVVVTDVDGQDMMSIKPMCYVSLTIDHRVLDAHQCNQFLSSFVSYLENY